MQLVIMASVMQQHHSLLSEDKLVEALQEAPEELMEVQTKTPSINRIILTKALPKSLRMLLPNQKLTSKNTLHR